MTDQRKCDKCGKVSFESRILSTPEGKIVLCWDCRRERDKAYRAADSIRRNAANRAKAKLLKLRGRFCQQCGRYMETVHAHHLLAVRLGGTEDPGNLLLLCEDCHLLEHPAGTRY